MYVNYAIADSKDYQKDGHLSADVTWATPK